MSDKKTLIHLTEQDNKLKQQIKNLEKRFQTFTKYNKRQLEKLEKKIEKLEKNKIK